MTSNQPNIDFGQTTRHYVDNLYESLNKYGDYVSELLSTINDLQSKVTTLESTIQNKDNEIDSYKNLYADALSRSSELLANKLKLDDENKELKSRISELENVNKESQDALRTCRLIQSLVENEVTKKLNSSVSVTPPTSPTTTASPPLKTLTTTAPSSKILNIVPHTQTVTKNQMVVIPSDDGNSYEIPLNEPFDSRKTTNTGKSIQYSLDPNIPIERIRLTADLVPYDTSKTSAKKQQGSFTGSKKYYTEDEIEAMGNDVGWATARVFTRIYDTIHGRKDAYETEEEKSIAYHNAILGYNNLINKGYKVYWETKNKRFHFELSNLNRDTWKEIDVDFKLLGFPGF